MFQPMHLDGFLRLLVSHLGVVIDQGEKLLEFYSDRSQYEALLAAIDSGDNELHQQHLALRRDYEALFVLQMSHAREWVDRLGQLDIEVERDADEFLATTFGIERLLHARGAGEADYRLENHLVGVGNNNILRADLNASINVEGLLCAIYELLGRLEDQYDLMEELDTVTRRDGRIPFAKTDEADQTAKIIPLFGAMGSRPHREEKPVRH